MDRATFTAPDILLLSTWDASERQVMGTILRGLHASYPTYVEPFSAAMVMPTVAAESGYKPVQMFTTDVSLYAAVVGCLCAGDDLAELEVRMDGEVLDLAGMEPVTQAAAILWTQLLARMEARSAATYWQEIVADVYFRRRAHMASIERGLPPGE